MASLKSPLNLQAFTGNDVAFRPQIPMKFHQCGFYKFQTNSNEKAILSKGILKKQNLGDPCGFGEFSLHLN
jgi:hypothetical protein